MLDMDASYVCSNWCWLSRSCICAFCQNTKWLSNKEKRKHMDIGSSYRCELTQHQCTAALFRAKCSFHCSVLLCKTGSQQAVFHCSYTYGDLLFVQLQIWTLALHTVTPTETRSSYRCAVTQHQCTAALFTENAVSTVQYCSAKQAHSRQCFTAVTPMDICSSYRCAVTQHKCSAALFRAKCSFHFSVLLCKTGSQQARFLCDYTYGDLLFIQVCSDPAPMHCSFVQGKMHFPLFSAALQNRLTAGRVSL
ncbi:TPA: hypothetical protein ACH3X1_016528 [Trebouxia sp. C0004]